MPKRFIPNLLALFLLIIALPDKTLSQDHELNKTESLTTRKNFKLAEGLAEREKFTESLIVLKKIIAAAPQFLQAHVKYIYVRAYFMGQETEVKAEYEKLIAKNPANPIYPTALAVALFAESSQKRRSWFEKGMNLAPDWNWNHYAKAQLLREMDPGAAVTELLKMIEKEPRAPQPYAEAIFMQQMVLKRIDDAIATAEKMSKHPDLRAAALSNLWRLNLAKAGTSEAAKAKLRQELLQASASSSDIFILAAVRSAYAELLADKYGAQLIEKEIFRIDSSWYPERGIVRATTALKENGPQRVVYAGRQLVIFNKMRTIDYDLAPEEQIKQLERLLALGPDMQMKQRVYARFFGAAERSGDNDLMAKFGEVLLTLDPNDASTLASVGLALANQKRDIDKAIKYTRRAEELTKEFRPLKDIPDIAGVKFLEEYYSEKEQEGRYKLKRAQILDSYGWALFQANKYAEAEAMLREAINIRRTENTLSHLSAVLRKLDRSEEAQKFALEARNVYTDNIKKQFTNTPSKDFELSTIDGRKIKLSDLKGKVVMLNFWATWCQPCIKEMPVFVKTYEKYKERGFEILAISVDDAESRPKVSSFVSQQKINFPIFYDDGIAKLYEARAFPTTLFIGKDGNIRYQNFGFGAETAERDLNIIIEELLKID